MKRKQLKDLVTLNLTLTSESKKTLLREAMRRQVSVSALIRLWVGQLQAHQGPGDWSPVEGDSGSTASTTTVASLPPHASRRR